MINTSISLINTSSIFLNSNIIKLSVQLTSLYYTNLEKVKVINTTNLNLNRGFLSFINNRGNVFIPSLVKYKYQDGGCSITASTSGCGPLDEGSTPSFRPT